MKTVCQLNQCAGCMACVDICPKQAITVEDSLYAYNAVINPNLCVGCDACVQVCQQNSDAELVYPIAWYQGWATDPTVRRAGSSGGLAGALSRGFLAAGGAVCSCAFEKGSFSFRVALTAEDAAAFAGSKYVKSNPVGSYHAVKRLLKEGTPVLFIGLPCQCAAAKRFVGRQLQENLFTVDLICHGSPSPAVLEQFLDQYGMTLEDIQAPSFRIKDDFRFADGGKTFTTAGTRDPYSIAFLNTLIYTDNCYSCKFACQKRVSDLSLGDSWGSDLPEEEVKKGISLVLCQTQKGQQLLDRAEIYLTDVDTQKAVANNHQLREPSTRPEQQEAFFQGLKKGEPFNRLVFKRFPKQCFRQWLKAILIATKLLKK